MNNNYNIEVLIKAQNQASAEIAKISDQVKKIRNNNNYRQQEYRRNVR